MPARRVVITEDCTGCGYCSTVVECPAGDPRWDLERCVGCGACVPACPREARKLEEVEEDPIEVDIDGERVEVEARWVEGALRELGVELEAPCGVGGCYACAVKVDGRVRPACNTALEEGSEVETRDVDRARRVVSGFQPHPVGGVGTPIELKDEPGYVEAACFAHGCNLRCPQCQNHSIAFGAATGAVLRPDEAAKLLVGTAREYGLNRVAISGGEPTLNPDFLVPFVERCREYGGPDLRIHVDTNGTYLTPGYVDELVEAGMTDIGVDVKGFTPETFARIAGVDEEEAERMVRRVLEILRYIVDEHGDSVFLGVGVPYNPELVDMEEVKRLVDWIHSNLGEDVQVCFLDYRPEFRRTDMRPPRYEEMVELERYAKSLGFERVHAQKTSTIR